MGRIDLDRIGSDRISSDGMEFGHLVAQRPWQ